MSELDTAMPPCQSDDEGKEPASMEHEIRQLVDRMAIVDVLHRYARAVDERDWVLFASCFTDDAQIDYTAVGGISGSLAEIRIWLADVLQHFAVVQHVVANIEVDVVGDTARARSYLLNPMGLPDEQGGITLFFEGAVYNDRLVRTPEGWRITHRTIQPTFSTRRHSVFARVLAP